MSKGSQKENESFQLLTCKTPMLSIMAVHPTLLKSMALRATHARVQGRLATKVRSSTHVTLHGTKGTQIRVVFLYIFPNGSAMVLLSMTLPQLILGAAGKQLEGRKHEQTSKLRQKDGRNHAR